MKHLRRSLMGIAGGLSVLVALALCSTASAAAMVRLDVDVGGDGQVTSSPPAINCPPGHVRSGCSAWFALNQTVTLSAQPTNPRSHLARWSAPECGTQPTCTIRMDGPRWVAALMTPLRFTFVKNDPMGDSTVSVGRATCGPGCSQVSGLVGSGHTVALDAQPGAASSFDTFSRPCMGFVAFCRVTVADHMTVTGSFLPGPGPGAGTTSSPVDYGTWLTFGVSGPGSVLATVRTPGGSRKLCAQATSPCRVYAPKTTLKVELRALRSRFGLGSRWQGMRCGTATCTVRADYQLVPTAVFGH